MTITVHHLNKSQSERILFLLEELSVPYEIQLHKRDPKTALAPDSLKAVNPSGTAPYMIDDLPNPNDTRVELSETGAIIDYILQVYGQGQLAVKPGSPDFSQYLYWLHSINGTVQPNLSRLLTLEKAGVAQDVGVYQWVLNKIHTQLKQMDDRLSKTDYLGGDRLTTPDCISMFTLTTMRGFYPLDLSDYSAVLAYIKRLSERTAYKRAMGKGDPGLEPMIQPKVEKFVWDG